MSDARRQLSDEGFSDAEADEIVRRALALQDETEDEKEEMDQASLEAGAAAVGVRREFIQRAITELRADRERIAAARAARRRALSTVGIVVGVFLVLSAFYGHSVLNGQLAEVEKTRAQLENVRQRRDEVILRLSAYSKNWDAKERALAASLQALAEETQRSGATPEAREAAEGKLAAAARELYEAVGASQDPYASGLAYEIVGSENRISAERKRHNEAVAAYRRTARSIPVVLVRPLLGFPANPEP
ncbi:MAG: LemA family protein [Armatimonadetes bacterium]|nr:LemA family protein [Armatimonadota bacterium]